MPPFYQAADVRDLAKSTMFAGGAHNNTVGDKEDRYGGVREEEEDIYDLYFNPEGAQMEKKNNRQNNSRLSPKRQNRRRQGRVLLTYTGSSIAPRP